MSRSNTPTPLSNDGLRYTAQELEILTQLSTLDVDNFVNHTDPPAAISVVAGFRTMALGILRNPHLPAPDPSIATRLRPERDEARARNNVLHQQKKISLMVSLPASCSNRHFPLPLSLTYLLC